MTKPELGFNFFPLVQLLIHIEVSSFFIAILHCTYLPGVLCSFSAITGSSSQSIPLRSAHPSAHLHPPAPPSRAPPLLFTHVRTFKAHCPAALHPVSRSSPIAFILRVEPQNSLAWSLLKDRALEGTMAEVEVAPTFGAELKVWDTPH